VTISALDLAALVAAGNHAISHRPDFEGRPALISALVRSERVLKALTVPVITQASTTTDTPYQIGRTA
jgi:hypothetical protein